MALDLNARLDLAHDLFKTQIGTVGHAGVWVLNKSVGEMTPEHLPRLDVIMDLFCSWSHVDGLCVEVLQPMMLAYPAAILEQLQVWNGSENRFKRRTSVVVFVRKVGKSGRFTDEGLRLCDNLIWDPEDIVQKGVGWALKDMMRGDPDRILDYVKALRRRGVSAVITLYAIRDIKGAERERILAIAPDKKKRPTIPAAILKKLFTQMLPLGVPGHEMFRTTR